MVVAALSAIPLYGTFYYFAERTVMAQYVSNKLDSFCF